jgi:tetratricopeptide (TPR) repeat protein
MQRALLDHNAGHVVSAAALYRRVLADPACPPVIWVKAANNLSVAQTQLGRPAAALEHLDRAAVLARDLGPLLVAVIANSRAWSTFHAGRITESLRHFEEAGELFAAAGLPLGEHYLDYTDALVDLRLLDEAAGVARSAVAEFERHGARLMAAEARLRCARLALALGDVETARAEAESAVCDLRRQRRTAWVARATVTAANANARGEGYSPEVLRRLRRAAMTLQRLGLCADAVDAHLAAGRAAVALRRPALARHELTVASDLARRQTLLVRLRGRLARALLATAVGSPGQVLRHCSQGLTDLARHRSALPSVELRVLAAGHGAELGQVGLRSLLPTASASRVLHWLERTRAASLLTVEPSAPGVDEDVTALRSIEHELRIARRERGVEPRDLVARQNALEARIRRRSWGHDGIAGAADAIVTSGELRGMLDGEWLVEFAAIDDRVLAVVVEPGRPRLIETGSLSAVHRETDALFFALRRLLRGGRFTASARTAAQDALATLSSQLIGPLDVPPEAPLVVVPSGPLLRVPWSPLRDGPLTVAPSATLWARSRRGVATASRGRDARPRVALVAGPGLPGAVEEVSVLRAIYPTAQTLLPPGSTVEATVGLVRQADLAHLACHGRLRSDSPLFSALELSDGPLTLHEMFARGVAPHRMVLAACHSGVERQYEGDEVLGFVSALMARGTAAVVASVVSVPDAACSAAMPVLHDSVSRGGSFAAALWQARSVLASGGPEEYVAWCGLTAYGPG